MSRNMIICNQRIFSRLIALARTSERAIDHLAEKRWIQTNADEKGWLQDLNIREIQTISTRTKTATFDYDGRNFFATTGCANRTDPESVMDSIDLNAGMVTALIDALDIPIRESAEPLVVINDILAQFDGLKGYSGHSFSSIADFFEPLAVYEIRADSPISPNNLARLSCFWTLQNAERIVLPSSDKTREQIEHLTITGASSIPYDTLQNCVQSAQWPHAFLEAYRCVERLFSIQSIDALHKELALPMSLLTFAEKLEDAIGWRPREEDAIAKLFGLMPPDAQALIEGVKGNIGTETTEKNHTWVYRLRNSVVHFRPGMKKISLTDDQWDELIRATILFIAKIYGTYDKELKAA